MTKAAGVFNKLKSLFSDSGKFIRTSMRKDLPEVKNLSTKTTRELDATYGKNQGLKELAYAAKRNTYGKPGVSSPNKEKLMKAVEIERYKRKMGL